MRVEGAEGLANSLSLSLFTSVRGPSLRPTTSHHPMAAHHPEAAAWSSRVRNLQVRDACARHCAASHASRTPPTHPPPRRQAAPGPAPPHAEARPENRAGTITSSPPRYAGITWFLAFGITPPVDLQAPQAWKRFFKSGSRRRPPNLLQFKLTAFLVPAPGSSSRAFECIDGGCQTFRVPRE